MSKNINQVYIANPSTSLPGTALLYAGLSPFGVTNDTAITVGNFLLQVPSATWVDVSSNTQAISPNIGYITDNGATLVTYTMPATIARGAIVEVAGVSSGGWIINLNGGQTLHFGNASANTSIASTNQWDYVKILCVVANTTFVVTTAVGNLTIV